MSLSILGASQRADLNASRTGVSDRDPPNTNLKKSESAADSIGRSAET
jgi:hypothetical protein